MKAVSSNLVSLALLIKLRCCFLCSALLLMLHQIISYDIADLDILF